LSTVIDNYINKITKRPVSNKHYQNKFNNENE